MSFTRDPNGGVPARRCLAVAAALVVALGPTACGGSGSAGSDSGDAGAGMDAAIDGDATAPEPDAPSSHDGSLDEQAPGTDAGADVGTADGGTADGAVGDAAPGDAASGDAPEGDAPVDALDAAMGADVSSEAASPDSSDDSGSCNSLTVTALVSFGCVPFQSPPPATGGTIAAGTYTLVSGTLYDPTGACTGVPVPTAETLDFLAGGAMQKAELASGWIATENSTFSFSASGNQLSTTETCLSPGQTDLLQYTATPTALTTTRDGLVLVYNHL